MASPGKVRARGGLGNNKARQAFAGWIFIAPVVVLLGLFLFVPVLMAAWVSVSDWTGRGSPFSSDVGFVGAENYSRILFGGGLDTQDFGTALRNNFYYVLLVVPLQTALSLFLAVLVSKRILRGRGFFRTAFYFPSVTSSVAITVLWLFLFNATGVINKILSWVSIDGPNWFADPRGVLHIVFGVFGVDTAPSALAGSEFLGDLVVGVARRALGRDERLHHDGDLHDLGHVHAAVHRGAAEHRSGDPRGRDDRPGQRLAALPATSRCRCCGRRCSPCSRWA